MIVDLNIIAIIIKKIMSIIHTWHVPLILFEVRLCNIHQRCWLRIDVIRSTGVRIRCASLYKRKCIHRITVIGFCISIGSV